MDLISLIKLKFVNFKNVAKLSGGKTNLSKYHTEYCQPKFQYVELWSRLQVHAHRVSPDVEKKFGNCNIFPKVYAFLIRRSN